MRIYPHKRFISVAGFAVDNGTLKVNSTTFNAQGAYTDGTRTLAEWEVKHLMTLLGDKIARDGDDGCRC